MGTSPTTGVSSDLILPGPQPPLTHFGATLLRHVVVTGLRYTLYHLGLPLPDKAPIRITDLRFYLEGSALEELLGESANGRAVLGALIDPAGRAGTRERPPRGAAFFHRQRLRFTRRRGLPKPRRPSTRSLQSVEHRFRSQLAEDLPALNDAFLGETLSALRRRGRRSRGAVLAPCLGPAAARWARDGKPRLDRLGVPDPFTPSWAEAAPALERRRILATGRDAGRGRFRELYRQALDGLRPHLASIASAALERGVIGHPEDVYFLPFELLGDLTRDHKPQWLDGALLSNRAEYFGLVREADAETVAGWAASPLNPLP